MSDKRKAARDAKGKGTADGEREAKELLAEIKAMRSKGKKGKYVGKVRGSKLENYSSEDAAAVIIKAKNILDIIEEAAVKAAGDSGEEDPDGAK